MLKEIRGIIDCIHNINGMLEDKTLNRIFNSSEMQSEDITYLYNLCNRLVSEFNQLNDEERELLNLNYQFAEINLYLKHHLKYSQNYLANPNKELKDLMIRNLLFVKTKIDCLKKEYEEKVIERMNSIDRELLISLAKYSLLRYQAFKKYFKLDLKSYVDQLHRDYRLTGFPDHLISSIRQIVLGNKYDYIICVLRAGLSYTLLFELLGFPRDRIFYIVSGRIHGKHASNEMDLSFTEISGNLKYIAGKNILIVDNNLYNGNTIKRVSFELNKRYLPANISLFLDYICPGSPLENQEAFRKKFDEILHEVHVAKNMGFVLKKAEVKEIKLQLIQKIKQIN